MDIIGIIGEYNPFHNGHLYHIKEIKKRYPNSLLLLVLNGYFLQRGEVSVLTKEDKTRLSLLHGVDLVVSLPVVYGTQAADVFSEKALFLLNQFQVQKVIFGSECHDIKKITRIASVQLEENFNGKVQNHLKTGINYPTALAKSIDEDMQYTPNDLLGISYAKAVIKNSFPISLETIKRTNDYHDLKSNEKIISASNIRNKLKSNQDITTFVPKCCPPLIKKVNQNTLFLLIKSKIITSHHLDIYLDVDEGIETRLKKMIKQCNNLEDFISRVKTKRYTYNKIRRMLIHILLGLTKDINHELIFDSIQILGFNERGLSYLNQIKKKMVLPLKVNKHSKLYEFEEKAALLYDLITNEKTYEFEGKNQPIIFDKV